MVFNKIIFLLLSAVFWRMDTVLAQKHENLHLQVGESHSLSLPDVEQISLSRKGVLHAKKTVNGNWILIGLKPGYTLLQAENSTEQFFVGVFVGKDTQLGLQDSDLDSDPDSILPAENHAPASTPLSRQQALVTLAEYFPKPYFRYEVIGEEIHVQMPCIGSLMKQYKDIYQKLSKTLSSLASTRYYCVPSASGNHQIEVFLTHIQSAEGFDYDGLRLQKNLKDWQDHYRPETFIPESHHEDMRDSLLSYPKLTFQLGSPAKFSSGGEMESPQILQNRDQTWSQNQWKRFGLDFNFEAVKLFDSQILLAYEAALNIPASLEGRLAVRGSVSQSQMLLGEGQLALAGIFDIISGSSIERKQSFLASLPIIGPLFWQESSNFKSSTIAMFVRITKD